jgi:5'-3' exonuclease
MGIPSYFSHLIKNHSHILKKFNNKKTKIDNLYLDSNSIIYDCLSGIKYESNEQFEKQLLHNVCQKIEEYIRDIQPTNTVYIAFDGVAPVAKLNQQRNRRYKSWFQSEVIHKLEETNSSNKSIKHECGWDKAAITPGTGFMKDLCRHIYIYFDNYYKFNVNNIIISASDEPGEGEHKIFDYIRKHDDEHVDAKTVIYGLDADLIMLSLNHLRVCNNLYLFRETPEFIKSIDRNLDPNVLYMMDIPELSNIIIEKMVKTKGPKHGKILEKYKTNYLYDYIFICFLLGNDFIPHFPSINIRTTGIDQLLDVYREAASGNCEFLTNGTSINWKQFRRYMTFLAHNEKNYLLEEYRIREKLENRKINRDKQTMEEKLNFLPMQARNVEKYINPREKGWESRYYKELFHIDINSDRKEQICTNFLEAIEWTMRYYTHNCPDWRWSYKYDYPPLLIDLLKYIPYFDTTFVKQKQKNPVNEYTQLAYVLPKPSLHLLSNDIVEYITKHFNYDTNHVFQWAFCKYFWEAHAEMPSINIDNLETGLKAFI